METQVEQNMTDQLTNKSIDILNWIEQSVKAGTTFVAEQTPLFIQELLAYNYLISIIGFVVSTLLLVFSLFMLYKILLDNAFEVKEHEKVETRYGSEMTDVAVVRRIIIGALVAVSFVVGVFNMQVDFIQIKLAPRVYLLEYTMQKINKK